MIEVKGVCVSKGNAKGVVLNIFDKSITVEDTTPVILVLQNLDRNILVSLRKNVVGVIAEHGNIGSHGAGILRDLKIPCIIRIKNAARVLKTGEYLELCGDKNCIICDHSELKLEHSNNAGMLYQRVVERRCSIKDIRPENNWVCWRPFRHYQKLRFDIISPVYQEMPVFLFGMKPAKARQNATGALEEYGNPILEDVCSFVINNPNWLVEMAAKRSIEISDIKSILNECSNTIQKNDNETFYSIFCTGIQQYRRLYKYAFMSQAISDEILDIYCDFIELMIGYKKTISTEELYSEYVNNCLKSGVDPGISQKWSTNLESPHIWDGKLINRELKEDLNVLDKISKSQNEVSYRKDYSSFRIIVPLVYQLSEEFFYISSSINSYIKWSIQKLYYSSKALQHVANTIEDVYELPLIQFKSIIEEENQWKTVLL